MRRGNILEGIRAGFQAYMQGRQFGAQMDYSKLQQEQMRLANQMTEKYRMPAAEEQLGSLRHQRKLEEDPSYYQKHTTGRAVADVAAKEKVFDQNLAMQLRAMKEAGYTENDIAMYRLNKMIERSNQEVTAGKRPLAGIYEPERDMEMANYLKKMKLRSDSQEAILKDAERLGIPAETVSMFTLSKAAEMYPDDPIGSMALVITDNVLQDEAALWLKKMEMSNDPQKHAFYKTVEKQLINMARDGKPRQEIINALPRFKEEARTIGVVSAGNRGWAMVPSSTEEYLGDATRTAKWGATIPLTIAGIDISGMNQYIDAWRRDWYEWLAGEGYRYLKPIVGTASRNIKKFGEAEKGEGR